MSIRSSVPDTLTAVTQPDPTPIPIPVVPIPVEPVAVEAMPVMPAAPPPMYQPYSAYSSSYSRPGIITAIGVSSIIVAAICLLGGFVMMMINMVVSSVARFAPPPPPATPVVVTPGPSELLGPNGSPAADRAVIIDGLGRVRPLTESQKQQLDELLTEEGKSVLPLSGPDISPEQVVANVTRSGHLSGGDPGGGSGTEYFVLGNGRLELTDDRAVFFPTNGQPPIRANAVNIPGGSGSVLQPDQIRSVIRAINRINGSNIKSAQARVIVQTLQGPGQQLISPTTDGSDPAGEITAASTDPADGSLTLVTHHGTTDSTLTLDASGNMTSSTSTSTSINGFSTSVNSTDFSGRTGGPNFNRNASQWMNFVSMIQIALAVYLLICGIFMLRQSSFAGRRMHWIYIGIKLPVALAACGVAWRLWSAVFTAQAASNPASGTTPATALWFVMPAAIGMIYPFVLLFVFALNKGVKTYFSAARYAA